MIAPKTRVQIRKPDAPLFPDDAPAPPPPARRWRGCPVCGTKEGQRAHPEHDVCRGCVEGADAAREHMETQRATIVRQQQAAAQAAQVAYDALDDAERARWTRICELRAKVAINDASQEERALVARTLAALQGGTDPRFTDGLFEVYAAGERLYWANAANEGMQRQLDVKLAQLAVCLEDLGA